MGDEHEEGRDGDEDDDYNEEENEEEEAVPPTPGHITKHSKLDYTCYTIHDNTNR